MNKFTTLLTVILVVCFILPVSAYVSMTPQFETRGESQPETEVDTETFPEKSEMPENIEKSYYPDFPDLPPPPAKNSPFYAVASPPPSYINSENRGSRIRVNTSTVISIDSPKSMDFVTLGQNFIVSGGLYEDNNSNGKNDTNDFPVSNGLLHIRWAFSTSQVEAMTDASGHFSVSVTNDRIDLEPKAYPLEIEFWGQWTINGSVYYQIPRNLTDNIPGYDDDGDAGQLENDGIDNDGDWRGWDGSSWNDDLNHNGQPDFNYDGIPFFDDDGNNGSDEETLNGVDDDNDGLVDEDCIGGDANGDSDSSYDPEPHIDEVGEGTDEEGVPDGLDSDGDTMIDEDCLLPFIPRQNTSGSVDLRIQRGTEMSLTVSPNNVGFGDTIKIEGQLIDPVRSAAIPGKYVILKFHDHIINITTTNSDPNDEIDDGKFIYYYQIPKDIDGDRIDVGRRKFSATFDQSYKPDSITFYKTSSSESFVRINRPTKITLTNEDQNVYLQDTISVTGRVTDETGTPLLFKIVNDDQTFYNVQAQDYRIELVWGPRTGAKWMEGPFTGYLGPEGNFTITFTMNNAFQDIREVPVNVTFFDDTNKYYTKSYDEQDFYVRAHSKILGWEEVKGFHRGETAYIRAQLVQQDGSITKGLADAQLYARWGPAGDFEPLSEKTRADGWFTYVREIDSDHQLGPVVVYMRYDNDLTYKGGLIDGFEHTENFAYKTYYVIAQPKISFQGGDIIKGESITFTGNLVDDAGRAMVNQYVELYFSTKQIINAETNEWEPDNPPIAFIPTDSTGKFTFDYVVPESFTVGTAYGAARFKGFQPPYNSTNAYDEATTRNIIFNVSASTSVVVDPKHKDEDLYRGRDFIITGKVYETYKGELTPTKVKPLHGEKLKVDVYLRAKDVFNATTYKVGEATIGKLGSFQVRAKVLASIEISEYVDITLVFNGNIRYERTTNASLHKLWGSVFFDRAEILASFPEKDEGRPAVHEENFNSKSKDFVEPWIIKVPIFEDIQGRQPPPVENATVYLNISGDYFVNSSVAITDSKGIATFQFISPLKDKDYPDRIKLLHRENDKYVLEVTITFAGSSGLQTESTSFNMTYYPTPPPGKQDFFDKYGTYVSLLVIITIVFVVFMIVFSSWYIKQQRLRGLKRIIKRAADQLIAGDQYRATIYKSYKKLSAHLRRYGYLRREAETFREFESAIKQALPVDRPSMHRFLDLLEEARYSSHNIGETQRHAAIANLRTIEGSLSQIIIDEEAAMRALRKLEEEESSMAAAETEIVVKPGAEGGGLPGGGPGGPPRLPPGAK